jgi:hypothetical protein
VIRRAVRRLGLLVPVAIVACGGEAAAPGGLALEKSGGDGQSGLVGTALAVPLAVTVRDAAGELVSGVTVAWTATGGTVPATSTSGPDGVATATLTLGTTAGPVAASAALAGAVGSPVSFTATAQAGPAAQLVRELGNGQTVIAGQPLPVPLTVRATDGFGNGVSGVSVEWAVTAGAGTLSPVEAATGSDGRARATLTPAAMGAVAVTATAGGLTGSPATFTATATIGVVVAAQLPVPANYGLHDQFVRDGLAFLCAWNSGLLVYDVGGGGRGGAPSNPVLISVIVTAASGVAGGAQVHNAWWYHAPNGQKRYVFLGQEGPGSIGSSSSGDIHVVDISNIQNPIEVASYHLAGAGTHNFWVDEAAEVLYAAYYNGGVVALDVSGTLTGNLAAREIARIQPGGPGNTYVWGVQLAGGSLYATDMLSGFWQLRLHNGAFSVLGGGNNVPERFGSDQWVAGGYAYSGTWGGFPRSGNPGNALKVWRLDAGGFPVLVDSIVVPGVGTVSDVEVSADGKLLMFSAENGSGAGIYFYSLAADPARPAFLFRHPVSSGVHTATFAAIGGRQYVFAAKNPPSPALLVLDVTALGL